MHSEDNKIIPVCQECGQPQPKMKSGEEYVCPACSNEHSIFDVARQIGKAQEEAKKKAEDARARKEDADKRAIEKAAKKSKEAESKIAKKEAAVSFVGEKPGITISVGSDVTRPAKKTPVESCPSRLGEKEVFKKHLHLPSPCSLYDQEEIFFIIGTLIFVFSMAKYYYKTPTFIALTFSLAGAKLMAGLFTNRFKHIAGTFVFLGLSGGYVHIMPILLKGNETLAILNPESFYRFVALLIWLFISLLFLGISSLIGYYFCDEQFSKKCHRIILYIVLTIGYGFFYAFMYGWWILLAGWVITGDFWGTLRGIVVIGMIFAIFKAKTLAVDLSNAYIEKSG